jgi:hypothetical protein
MQGLDLNGCCQKHDMHIAINMSLENTHHLSKARQSAV